MSDAAPVEHAGHGVGAALGHKIGPLPAGVWIAVVAGALGIAWYTRTHAAPTALAASSDTTQDSTDTVTGDHHVDGTGSGDQSAVTTNDQWETKATTYLISQGASGTSADEAVRNYLAGNTLSVSQTALVDLVLAAIGPPPTAPALPDSGVVGTSDHPMGSSGGTSTADTTVPPVVYSPPVYYSPPAPAPAADPTLTTSYKPGTSLYSVVVGGRTISFDTTQASMVNQGQHVAGWTSDEQTAVKVALVKAGLA